MKRLYTTALAAALAAAVPAWAGEQVLTLTKDGKPHQYKVLKTYKHPSGGTAYDVKDATTGELMTVIDNAAPEQIQLTGKTDVVIEERINVAAKADPILEPKSYVSESSLQKMGIDPTSRTTTSTPRSMAPTQSGTSYTRQPVPAAKRWFSVGSKDAKPAMAQVQKPGTPAGQTVPAVGGMIEAAYHPDMVYRLIGSLRDDLLPSMREVAATELAGTSGTRPEAIEALVYSAGADLAPSVRLCCVRLLSEMRVRTPECQATLQKLQSDRDQGVRTEAGIVLTQWQAQ